MFKKILVYITLLLVSPILSYGLDYRLKWDKSVDDIDGYVVYFTDSVEESRTKYQKVIVGVDNNLISIRELGVLPDIQYTYYVSAYYKSCISDLSNPVTFTLPGFDASMGDKLPEDAIVILAPEGTVIVTINTGGN